MNEILKVILSLSLSGTLLILLLFLFRPLFKERLSKRWQYYIWLVVVARLLFPFATETNLMAALFQGIDWGAEQTEISSPYTQQGGTIDNPQTDNVTDGQNNLHSEQTESAESVNSPGKNTATAVRQNLWIGWLVVALILFIRKITIYQDFVKYIRASCMEVADINLLERFGKLVERNRIKTTVELYTNNLVSSPLLIGFFRPCIVLPTTNLPPADFDFTILHELMHFKRRDMFYKWLAQITVCVHWFNPFVYLMSREISRVCELSCDEAVIRELDMQGRRAYGDTLLNAIGFGGNYKDSRASLTLNESKEILIERLDSIMNFKKIPKWGILTSLLLTAMLICGFTFSGAYTANTHDPTNPNAGMDTVSLKRKPAEIIGFQKGEEVAAKDVAINITEDHAKIQLNAVVHGDSLRTLEVIDPDGEVVRTYTFNQNGVISGSREYLTGFTEDGIIMVTDVVYPGIWYVRLNTDQTPAEKTSVTAKLIHPSVWGFTTDTDTSSDEIENEKIKDDSPLLNQMYDFYRTYEQTKEDIQNGYIVNTGVSFSERAMPMVTGGSSVRGTSFYVNHDNSIDISITLKNLIDGSGHHFWEPITDVSFVYFGVYDPSGNVAYSFYKEGKEIENEVDIDTEIDVYPGEWQYKISFAYTTNGIDTSDMEFSLRYETIFEDDIQWLVDNKLNKIN